MKVLRLICSLSPEAGGPGQGIRNMTPELDLNGIATDVTTLDDPDAGFLQNASFNIHALGRGYGAWAYNPALLPWLKAHVTEYEVIVLHGLWQYHGYALFKALRYLRSKGMQLPKVYIYPHGMLDPWFQRDPSRRVKAVRNWFYWKLIERHLIEQADALLFTTEEERVQAETAFHPYRPRSTVNIGYGIPVPPVADEAHKRAFIAACPELEQAPYLLYLSRIHPKKGVDLLIRAYVEIAEGMSDRSAEAGSKITQSGRPFRELPTLVIAGPLDSNYSAEMRSLASGLLEQFENLPVSVRPPRIIFPGMLQGDAKWGRSMELRPLCCLAIRRILESRWLKRSLAEYRC